MARKPKRLTWWQVTLIGGKRGERLGMVQALKQVAQGSADGRRQCREALAGARFDERAANHQIDFAMRLGLRDQPAHALGIAAGSQALRRHPEAPDELRDLLVMAQFLAGESRHFVSQIEVFRVSEHQREGGRCRLLFAVCVIDQQHVRRRAGLRDPARRGGDAQQGMRKNRRRATHAGILNAEIASSSSPAD